MSGTPNLNEAELLADQVYGAAPIGSDLEDLADAVRRLCTAVRGAMRQLDELSRSFGELREQVETLQRRTGMSDE